MTASCIGELGDECNSQVQSSEVQLTEPSTTKSIRSTEGIHHGLIVLPKRERMVTKRSLDGSINFGEKVAGVL